MLAHELGHRGPDGCGRYEADLIALVHTRLSIIDLSANGNQPMYNEDQSIILVCNGEIYNYQGIREQLLQKGHTFSSHSDCEVILHLYEEHRNDPSKLLKELTGMFAFAIWDTARKKLFIARDRVGIKPMYYSFHEGRLVFASEIKPIAATGLTPTKTDYTSLYEYYLLGSIPGPNTLYQNVKALEPGHYLVVEGGKLSITEYWDIPKGLKSWASEADAIAEADKLLTEVIKDHLVADVPVGTFLSAGVDSSLITAVAVGHHPGIHSFTASFPGEPEDEGVVAGETAKRLQTTHHSYELTTNFFNDFTTQFRDIDQPFAISSALSLGRISKVAREHVKVALSGDGGDELFGGYKRYEFPKQPGFLKFIPQPLQNTVLQIGAKVTGKKSLETLRQNLQITDWQRFVDKIRVTEPAVALSFFAPEIVPEIDTQRFTNRVRSLFEKRRGEDPLNQVLYVDMKTTLVDEMLTKCDRMTMINGIEGRVPFLDHRMVELAFSMPASFKRKNGVGKIVLRELLAKRLGNELAYRVKTGFNSPLQQWLASDQQTIAFVRKEIQQASGLAFVNKNTLGRYAAEPHRYPPGLVFSLVCLNHYFQGENTDTHK